MALPRVISQRGKSQIEIDRENFEKAQTISITKAISSTEAPCKEKHVRSTIIGTFTDSGAGIYWSVVNKLPLQGNPIVCWKFCNVLHKVLRDGHKNCILDSLKYSTHLKDLGKLWGHLKDGYGRLIALYTKLLVQKLTFHKKYPGIPGNLQRTDEELEQITGRDVNSYFEFTVDLLDYMDEILALQAGVFGSLDMSRSNSMTTTGQCRLAPLIQCIQDSAPLYDYIVKLLFKLHSSLPADTLAGHRARFLQQYKSLKQFYHSSHNLQYFKHLIQIPSLPENPPNFLVASDIESHARPVVVIPAQPDTPEMETRTIVEDLVDTAAPPPVPDRFDSVFGNEMAPFSFNGNKSEIDERDKLIEQLRNEIEQMKKEIDRMKAEHVIVVQALHQQSTKLEKELETTRKELNRLTEENQRLKEEAEKSAKNEDAVQKLDETERLAKANEEKFKKMKDIYGQLREEHVKLLRGSGEYKKQMATIHKELQEKEQEKKEIVGQLQLAQNEKKMIEEMMQKSSDDTTNQLAEQTSAVMVLQQEKKDLESKLETIEANRTSLETLLHESDEKLKEIENAKMSLESSLRETEEKLHDLEVAKDTADNNLEQTITQLKDTQELKTSLEKRVEELQNSLKELESKMASSAELWKISEDDLKRQLKEAFEKLLLEAVEEAELILMDCLEQMDNPSLIAVKSSPDYLISRLEPTVHLAHKLRDVCNKYKQDPEAFESLEEFMKVITTFGFRLGESIIQGKATSHQAPIEQGDDLAATCRRCGEEGLDVLNLIKQRDLDDAVENIDALLMSVNNVLGQAEALRPKVNDVKVEEIGDLVDQELAATTEAIELAAARFEDLLAKSRADQTGIQLEVNERIIDSCTSLMTSIRILIEKSKALQREIVAQGRGGSTAGEFYKHHHRWTEGLLSAAKAVGWAASTLVDAADKLVSGEGKFEEVIVCSQEIAASTAQLVVASRVKADPNSKCLSDLKEASKKVTQCTGNVVASTKSGAELIDEKDNMDFSNLTLTQAKRLEMNSQVKVLELESSLEKERRNLAELRKKHYQLAGESEGWEVEENGE